ncbi:MAG TPA: hypothetical protein VN821_08640 [Candidatus Udaeobacter sp.]|nr:hypothetical protein [Candidatus Udaeobacter sp.]
MRLSLLLVVSLALGGCAALPLAGVAAGSSALTVALAVNQDSSIVLTAVQPITAAWCSAQFQKPHTPTATSALVAFCGNLPTDPATMLKQIVAVVAAVQAEQADNKTSAKDDMTP